jgi:glycosyltransferase involved in cell wall biosynthesis
MTQLKISPNNRGILAVVIPCFKVKKHILDVINSLGSEIDLIYVIDDCCPEKSGHYVAENCTDARLKIIFHAENQGVGGAVMSGYKAAIADNAEIIVKIDGDGQMDTSQINRLITPIVHCEADYTKGNRFFNVEELSLMPKIRIFGNAVLSMMSKFSSGYWDLFDPTNGFTAIHTEVAKSLPFQKISKRYFFETDILFRLNIMRAVAIDIPMPAKYGDEISNLKIHKIIGEFLIKHCINFIKRIFYNYYLRDMSLASIQLPLGILLLLFGLIFGISSWLLSSLKGLPATSGTVMLASLPILMGMQLILAFLAYDIYSTPKRPLLKSLLINK